MKGQDPKEKVHRSLPMFNSVFPLDSFANLKVVPEAEKSLRKSDLEAGSLEAGKPRAFRSPIVLRKYKLDFRGN